jgi:hypothetical protein
MTKTSFDAPKTDHFSAEIKSIVEADCVADDVWW